MLEVAGGWIVRRVRVHEIHKAEERAVSAGNCSPYDVDDPLRLEIRQTPSQVLVDAPKKRGQVIRNGPQV